MTREQEFFLHVLADHIHGRATNPPEGLDWSQIAKYAKSHEVEGIVYYQCKDYLTQHEELAAVNKRLSKASAAAMFYYANRTAMVEQIKTEFKQHEIEFFTFKGDAVAPLYPVPMLRTMGDTDFAVHTNDCESVHQIMIRHGFENRSMTTNHEWPYYKDGLEVEIHNRLIYPHTINEKEHEEYFNDFWRFEKEGELNWSFHFLFLLYHLRKHLLISGVGFRHFLDLCVVVISKREEISWEWINIELERLGLLRFAEICSSFCNLWFETQIPISILKLDEEFYDAASEKIFSGGVFGFKDASNKKNAAINVARKSSQLNLVSMIAFACQKVFPNYQKMIESKPYAFLVNRPFLLPAAWIYRLFRGVVRGKIKLGIEQVKLSFASHKEYKKRDDMLKEWGL